MEENNYSTGKHVMLMYDPTDRVGSNFNKLNGFFVDRIDSIKTEKRDDGNIDIIVNDIHRIDNVDMEVFHEISVSIKFGYDQRFKKDYVVEVV